MKTLIFIIATMATGTVASLLGKWSKTDTYIETAVTAAINEKERTLDLESKLNENRRVYKIKHTYTPATIPFTYTHKADTLSVELVEYSM